MAQQTSISEAALPVHAEEMGSALPQWARLMGTYIGIIPLPVYILLVAVVAGILWSGPVPTEMAMVLSIMLVGSFTLAEIGNRQPYVRNIGAAGDGHQALPARAAVAPPTRPGAGQGGAKSARLNL